MLVNINDFRVFSLNQIKVLLFDVMLTLENSFYSLLNTIVKKKGEKNVKVTKKSSLNC